MCKAAWSRAARIQSKIRLRWLSMWWAVIRLSVDRNQLKWENSMPVMLPGSFHQRRIDSQVTRLFPYSSKWMSSFRWLSSVDAVFDDWIIGLMWWHSAKGEIWGGNGKGKCERKNRKRRKTCCCWIEKSSFIDRKRRVVSIPNERAMLMPMSAHFPFEPTKKMRKVANFYSSTFDLGQTIECHRTNTQTTGNGDNARRHNETTDETSNNKLKWLDNNLNS